MIVKVEALRMAGIRSNGLGMRGRVFHAVPVATVDKREPALCGYTLLRNAWWTDGDRDYPVVTCASCLKKADHQ